MWRGNLGWRQACSALALTGILVWSGDVHPVEASARYDWCSNTCGETASCSEECENDGGGTTTCGEYQGGASNDMCGVRCNEVCSVTEACSTECVNDGPQLSDCGTYNGGACGNTCDVVCSPLSSSCSTSCVGPGGSSTTCGAYGACVTCGDNICAPSEVCTSCQDCDGTCPQDPIPPDLKTAVPQEPGFDEGTVEGLCQQANLKGWADWDCPEWEELTTPEANNPLCSVKNAEQEMLRTWAAQLTAFGQELWEQEECEDPGDSNYCALADEYLDAGADVKGIHDSLQNVPCYLYL